MTSRRYEPRIIGSMVGLLALRDCIEPRGALMPIDLTTLPFTPRRVFVVRQVPPGTTRGGHAHRAGCQLIVRLAGEIRVDVRSDGAADHIVLTDSSVGLLIPAPVWASQTYLTPDAALLVLSSEPFEPAAREGQ